jgi:hypothetical protein
MPDISGQAVANAMQWGTVTGTLDANASASHAIIVGGPGLNGAGFVAVARSVSSAASAIVQHSFTLYGQLTTNGASSWNSSAVSLMSGTLVSTAVAVTGATYAATIPPFFSLKAALSNSNTDSSAAYTITAGIFGQQN